MRVRVGVGDAAGGARRPPDAAEPAPVETAAAEETAVVVPAAAVAPRTTTPSSSASSVLPASRPQQPPARLEGELRPGLCDPHTQEPLDSRFSQQLPLLPQERLVPAEPSQQLPQEATGTSKASLAADPGSPSRGPADEPYNSEDEHEAVDSRGKLSAAAAASAAAATAAAAAVSAAAAAASAEASAARFQGRSPGQSPGYANTNRDRERDRLGERAFVDLLRKKQLLIMPVRPDGNCLFRSLAVHIYDTEDDHTVVRDEVLDFVEEEREWFSMFIAEDFTRYVRRKRRNGCHGNHLELQAAAELYGRPIEVYAYRSEPVTVIDCAARLHSRFVSGVGSEPEPLRISFHRGSHYNCVLRIERARELQRAFAAGVPRTRAHAPAAERKARQAIAAAAASAARREMERGAGSPCAPTVGPEQTAPRSEEGHMDTIAVADIADALATEEEMERAAMALSLAEARQAASRGAGSAGSSSSHSSAAMYNDFTPASVTALIDMGFSEERALEAYLNTDHGSAYDMMRYISQQIIQSKRVRSPPLAEVASIALSEQGHDVSSRNRDDPISSACTGSNSDSAALRSIAAQDPSSGQRSRRTPPCHDPMISLTPAQVSGPSTEDPESAGGSLRGRNDLKRPPSPEPRL
jgi:OTU-like cysteine protease